MWRRRLRDLALILGISALLLAVLEGGARAVERVLTGHWPETRDATLQRELREVVRLYRLHPFLNTAPAPGVSVSAFGKRAGFNSLGYRSPERPLAKPPGIRRVICAGGSTTFDILAPHDKSTWPQRLESILRERGHEVEVWNAGFPGWTSLENSVSLLLRDLDLAPDVVVLFQGLNDLQPAAHRPVDRQYVRGHADVAREALGFEIDPLPWFRRSVLVERLRDWIIGPTDPWRRSFPRSGYAERHPRLTSEAVGVFRRNVGSFTDLAQGRGAAVLLVSQTVRLREASRQEDLALLARWLPDLQPTAAPRALDRLNRILDSVARTGPAEFADAARDVPWEDQHFGDAMHFSESGSARFAQYLAPHVERLLVTVD